MKEFLQIITNIDNFQPRTSEPQKTVSKTQKHVIIDTVVKAVNVKLLRKLNICI